MGMTEIRVQQYEYEFTSHGSDWSRAADPLGNALATIWKCANKRAMPWEFISDLMACARKTNLGSALETSRSYVRSRWSKAWWRRRFVKTVVTPISQPMLQDTLKHNGLPSTCGRENTRDEL